MADPSSTGATVQDVFRSLIRHRRASLLCFAVILGAVALWTFLAPKTYRSEGMLFLRLGRENATLDPTATLGQNPIVAVPQSRENEINSVVEILQSRALMEKVADAVTPQAILGGNDDRERAVERLSKKLKVEAARKSNVVEIVYEGASPELCQQVVAKLIDFYLDEHVRLNRTSGSYEFLTAQTAQLRASLAGKEAELRDLKSQTGLAVPGAQRQLMATRIGRLEDDVLQAESARAVAEAKVRDLREKVAALPDTQVTNETTGFGDDGTDRMRDQFYALQVREKEAAAKYSEEHPKMRQIREQIAAARALLDHEVRGRKHVTKEPGRLHEQARLALLTEEPVLASLVAQAEKLRGQLVAVRRQLAALNESEMRVAALQRDVDLLDADYRKYATNLEQSRIDQQLEIQRLSNVSVAQSASLEPRPIRPRRALNLLLGLCVATFGGLALPLALDQFPAPMAPAERVAEPAPLPTMARIPSVRAERWVERPRKVPR